MLTFEDFRKLPRSEQNERYHELSDHDKFLARMNDYPPNAVVTLSSGMAKDEKHQWKEHVDAVFEQYFAEQDIIDKNK